MQKNIPFIEKYRPTQISDIVLEPYNRRLFYNIIHNQSAYFPNLLLYGPPGTGKTTSIINLINEYQQHNSQHNSASASASASQQQTTTTTSTNLIHLNASDERGIDIIRNQINLFIHSSHLFETGLKFVILDEVDYMTKSAQQALKYILQTFEANNVRFFLICNYISKIDESLQKEFTCIQFNQLPRQDIKPFLIHICREEQIDWTDEKIETIMNLYHYDIRSMVNCLQLNHPFLFENSVVKKLQEMFVAAAAAATTTATTNTLHHEEIKQYIQTVVQKYNMDEKQLILIYFNTLLMNYNNQQNNKNQQNHYINQPAVLLSKWIDFVETIIHNLENEVLLDYFIFHETQNNSCSLVV